MGKIRKFAEIPLERREQGLRWIVLEDDTGTAGVAVYLHRALDEPCQYDSWHETLPVALRQIEAQWGITQAQLKEWPADQPYTP